ncbi:MAG: 2-methylcitrate dehydratase [Streptosporangiales bacterium]|nr:2-methylcitrate dehydratase [Streptosporangiales bacterium]
MTGAPGEAGHAAVERAVRDLAAWAAELRVDDVPAEVRDEVRDRLSLVLYDTLGVTAVGARLPEQVALARTWAPPPGPAPVIGGGLRTTPDAAAWLNAVAACSLELDEGNKYARGHPAGHGFPAVLAMAAAGRADGPTTCAALLAAYEVASRFGRATTPRSGLHPHGNWGVAGAAAGVARLLGLGPDRTAAAIDAAAGLPVAGHFDSALSGNPVRNAWMAASNVHGIAAARMAAAGVARATGTAASTLGDLLGSFAPSELVERLGDRYDVRAGYFKRHASCSYTHPPVNAVLELKRSHPDLSPGRITAVEVETHSLGAGLTRTVWPSRLAAMFSTPYVVAAAIAQPAADPLAPGGGLGPDATSQEARTDPDVAALADRVRVRVADDLDRRLPDERAARVTVALDDGRRLVATVPNPVGDAAYRPFGWADVEAKLAGLLGEDDPVHARIRGAVRGLPDATDVTPLLQPLGDP